MADKGVEAMMELFTDDIVCCVVAVKEDVFAAPNSASVLYFRKRNEISRESKSKKIVTWKTSIFMAFIDTISVIKAYAMAGWLLRMPRAAAGVVF